MNSTMSSRERVLRALAHQEPDRVPIDCGGMRSSGIAAIAYGRLKDYLALREGAVYVFDVRQQLAVIEPPVRERFGADVLSLDLDQLGDWQPYTLPDGRQALMPASYQFEAGQDGSLYWLDRGKRIAKLPNGGYYFDLIDFPLAGATSLSDLEEYNWGGHSDEQLAILRSQAVQLSEQTDKAIMGRFSGSVYERGQKLRGFERFMLDLAEGGPFVEAFLEKLTEAHLRDLERYLAAVGEHIHLIQMRGAHNVRRRFRRPCIGAGSSRITAASTALYASATRTCTCFCIVAARSTRCCPT